MSRDKYHTFEMLRRNEPANAFHIHCLRRPSDVVIIAPHGGKIEPWTSEIAAAISGDDHNLYCFEGRKRNGNRDLHITSHRFDEPQALELLARCSRVVAVHGCAGDEEVSYLGGLDHALRDAIGEMLKESGFAIGRHENPDLQGVHPRNICNRGSRGVGMQLELSHGLRSALTRPVVAEEGANTVIFAAAIRAGINMTG